MVSFQEIEIWKDSNDWPACWSKSGRADDKIVSGVWEEVTVKPSLVYIAFCFLPSAAALCIRVLKR